MGTERAGPWLATGFVLVSAAAVLNCVQDVPPVLVDAIQVGGLAAAATGLSQARTGRFSSDFAAIAAWLLAAGSLLSVCLSGLGGWGYGWTVGCAVATIQIPAEPVPGAARSAMGAALAICCLSLQSMQRTSTHVQ
ncbi:hypothetical protein [Nitratireductor sp. XY-223]|uniref:hypothetical protein n=1 Tax=Nitratireductor sp. XY-223 TaxID=2561926 RepID=UPI0010AAB72F|nr:hypothetical protein [Nitratireductor sp. XY-223]